MREKHAILVLWLWFIWFHMVMSSSMYFPSYDITLLFFSDCVKETPVNMWNTFSSSICLLEGSINCQLVQLGWSFQGDAEELPYMTVAWLRGQPRVTVTSFWLVDEIVILIWQTRQQRPVQTSDLLKGFSTVSVPATPALMAAEKTAQTPVLHFPTHADTEQSLVRKHRHGSWCRGQSRPPTWVALTSG